ncbi:hypothetical protein GCM10009430_07070 [Aquimarina litoralis]|uniref:Lipoprotein n=1 Tax=Aquimarina litoralis TaxID=584605 RepID=A0ABN1II41_9FLAO
MKRLLLIVASFIVITSCNSGDDRIEEKNCCSQDSYVIEVNNLPEGKDIEAPQYFTPNGDGFHDIYYFSGLEEFPNNSVKFFLNENLVFEADSFSIEDSQSFSQTIINEDFDTRVYRFELEIDEGNIFKAIGYICAIKVRTNEISCRLEDPEDPDPVILD